MWERGRESGGARAARDPLPSFLRSLIYGATLIPALALAGGMAAFGPDSPRWLLLAGKGADRARAALSRARGGARADPAAVDAELAGMMAAADAARELSVRAPTLGELLGSRRYRRPLAVGLGLVTMQQVTGQPSVLYYAASIFAAAGFAEGAQASSVAAGLGVFKLLATGVAVAAVDRAGRRPLLIGGVCVMVRREGGGARRRRPRRGPDHHPRPSRPPRSPPSPLPKPPAAPAPPGRRWRPYCCTWGRTRCVREEGEG